MHWAPSELKQNEPYISSIASFVFNHTQPFFSSHILLQLIFIIQI